MLCTWYQWRLGTRWKTFLSTLNSKDLLKRASFCYLLPLQDEQFLCLLKQYELLTESCPVLYAADTQQWFMSTAVIWQLAQRFKPTNTAYANWIDVSLLLHHAHIRRAVTYCQRDQPDPGIFQRPVCSLRLLPQSLPYEHDTATLWTHPYLFPPAKWLFLH